MSDEPKKPGVHHSGWLIAAILILIVYPLSIGPFAFLAGTGHVPDGIMALGIIYTPLELIGQAVPSIGTVIHNYGDAFYRQGLRFR